MGKKSKKSSPGKSSAEAKVPLTEFYNGHKIFFLPNGDTYVGDYCAHRSGTVWREGRGYYYTKDGHVYVGNWQDDRLIDDSPVEIIYPNGDIFVGNQNKNKYEKSGEMSFGVNGGFRLLAQFEANKPTGRFLLLDPSDQLWHGNASVDSGIADKISCRQEHGFFQDIHPLRGMKKDILATICPEWCDENITDSSMGDEEISSMQSCDNRQLEQLVFGKKPKIDTEMDWKNSAWYRNFMQYKNTREHILGKVETRKPLTASETKWYRRYAIARKNRMKTNVMIKDPPLVGPTLMERFYSTAHQKSATPVPVFMPSYDWHVQNETVNVEHESSTERSIYEMDETNSHQTPETSNMSENEAEEVIVQITPNNALVGCGTRSLYEFIETTTGRKQKRSDCGSIL